MFPHTRKLVETMMQNDAPERSPMWPSEEPAMHDDPRVLQLQLKRRYQMGMLKKMLEESGYGDLAKMTTLSKRDFDDNIE